MPEETTCYQCVHSGPCEFFRRIHAPGFPFKDDRAIGPYLKAQTRATAEACAHYQPKETTHG